jgi:hypothetical protein
VDLSVEKGNVYFMFQHLTMGLMMAGNKLELVNEEEGRKILKKCNAPATSLDTQAEPLPTSVAEGTDLKQYRIVTINPFTMEAGDHVDPLIGADFANEIYEQLKNSYPGIFDEVRKGPVLGSNGELVVTGTITKYDPGNISERGLLIGLGAASFDAELTLKDAKSGQVLLTAPIKKLWAWGGAQGVSKRIENMMFEASTAIAGTIAHGKGWQAPPAR